MTTPRPAPSFSTVPLGLQDSIDPTALRAGIAQFNGWRFYDCHETLEDIWLAEEAEVASFYQALIKLAAGFHHLLRGNYRGAISLWAGGLSLLRAFPQCCLGVDVARLATETERCQQVLQSLGPERIREFDRSLIPAIVILS